MRCRLPFPTKAWKKVGERRRRRRRRRREGEGVRERAVCLLCRADIIKDSPCVLPLPSSKGTLAPGSSASYSAAPAEKRLREWLWMAEDGTGAGGGGDTARVAFPIYFTNNSACFPHTCACKPLPLSSALSHPLRQLNTQYISVNPLNVSLFFAPPVLLSASFSLCLPLLNNPHPRPPPSFFLFLPFLRRDVSSRA